MSEVIYELRYKNRQSNKNEDTEEVAKFKIRSFF